MKLTNNFSLEEFTLSQTASRSGIDNTPSPAVIDNLRKTAFGLEKIRSLTGFPLSISSGYRSPALNEAVKGARNSQHVLGQAADITCPRVPVPTLMQMIVRSGIDFDQCILEFNAWVHVSFCDKPRRQALVIDKNGTRPYS